MTVEITREPGALVVRFGGADVFWALSRGITVPLERLERAHVMTRRDAAKECPKMRLPGSYLPKRLHAGSYGTGERRQLWCVHRAGEVLVLDLRGRPYRRVVVEVPDPHAEAARLASAATPDAGPRP